jgi:hypothetical protein
MREDGAGRRPRPPTLRGAAGGCPPGLAVPPGRTRANRGWRRWLEQLPAEARGGLLVQGEHGGGDVVGGRGRRGGAAPAEERCDPSAGSGGEGRRRGGLARLRPSRPCWRGWQVHRRGRCSHHLERDVGELGETELTPSRPTGSQMAASGRCRVRATPWRSRRSVPLSYSSRNGRLVSVSVQMP